MSESICEGIKNNIRPNIIELPKGIYFKANFLFMLMLN
jgi:hypothetical protein